MSSSSRCACRSSRARRARCAEAAPSGQSCKRATRARTATSRAVRSRRCGAYALMLQESLRVLHLRCAFYGCAVLWQRDVVWLVRALGHSEDRVALPRAVPAPGASTEAVRVAVVCRRRLAASPIVARRFSCSNCKRARPSVCAGLMRRAARTIFIGTPALPPRASSCRSGQCCWQHHRPLRVAT
jgi:hypothetical protein